MELIVEASKSLSRTFTVPPLATNVQVSGSVGIQGGLLGAQLHVYLQDSQTGQTYIDRIVRGYDTFNVALTSGKTYDLLLYNDAFLAGDDKQETATFTSSYN